MLVEQDVFLTWMQLKHHKFTEVRLQTVVLESVTSTSLTTKLVFIKLVYIKPVNQGVHTKPESV